MDRGKHKENTFNAILFTLKKKGVLPFGASLINLFYVRETILRNKRKHILYDSTEVSM